MKVTWIQLPEQTSGPSCTVYMPEQSFVFGTVPACAAGPTCATAANRSNPPSDTLNSVCTSAALHCHDAAHAAPRQHIGRVRAASAADQ